MRVIQTVTLSIILVIAMNILPERIKSTVSRLNVENVLNPPQKPTTINNFNVGFAPSFSLKIPTASANTKQLNIFDTNVAIGKEDLKFDFTISEIP
jgi:hypothetical protein